ncbi:MAG TPA: Maf family protein [Alphaproteobacteria bacterium]|nr:Maf family protein [Alphaproteobacteria bacterium]
MTAARGLVLASASHTRLALLQNAGLEVVADPADIDEAAVKAEMRRDGAAAEAVAVELATRKAQAVAARHPDRLVIGADQMLDAAGQWIDKPADRAAAASQLAGLAGRAHRLISATVILEAGREIWRIADSATLHMRQLSPTFIEHYLDRMGAAALTSVGGYQLEGLGAQLFTKIEGDYFTILGLPLLPLLAFLRKHGIVEQ